MGFQPTARTGRILSPLRRWRDRRSEERSEYKHRAHARSLLRTLVEARNERDRDERRELIQRCWGPAAALIEGGQIARGRTELEDRFERDNADPDFLVEIIAPVRTRDDDEVWTYWEISGVHRDPVVQAVTAQVERNTGLLSRVRVTPARHAQASPWRRALNVVAGNPLAAAGVIGTATYLAMRLPAHFFYGRLGTTPDEVGLGAEVMVPQSLPLLGVLLVGGALAYPAGQSQTWLGIRAVPRLWQDGRKLPAVLAAVIGFAVFLAIVVGAAAVVESLASEATPREPAPDWLVVVVSLLVLWAATFAAPRAAGMIVRRAAKARRDLTAERWRRRDRWERRSVFLGGALATALTIVLLLSIIASLSGVNVRNGGEAGGELFPWRALPAKVAWKPTAARAELTNRCGELRMLGSANGHFVLFDTRLDRAFRVPTGDASVATAVDCLWVRVETVIGGHHCTAGRCVWDVDVYLETSDDHAAVTRVIRVRECDSGRCTYRRPREIVTDEFRLAAGHYRLTVTAKEGHRTAEQVNNFRVP
jgi:hypothetical protein